MTGDPRAPVAGLDAPALAAAVESATGERLTVLGLAAGGQVGAAFVRRGDGSECVMSRGGDADALRVAARALELARAAGLPVPRYVAVVPSSIGTVLLQERLPGAPPRRVDDALVSSLLDVVDRLAGLLTEASWVPVPDLYLTRSGPGFCVHESLATYDHRTRRLLDWVRSVGALEGTYAPGPDLVHLDLHPGNVVVDDRAAVTGIVDWDAAGRGDARLGVVTLLFDLLCGRQFDPRYADLPDAAVAAVEERVRAIDDPRRRQLWAHMALRQVDWSIRHHSAELVEHHLGVALAGLDRFGLG